METAKLKKFAQFARRSLMEQVSAKLKLVMAENSAARRESGEAIKKLEEVIRSHGEEQVVERVAYIWFNRFCALRFMDVNRYTRIGVVSPAEGQFQPEILAEAKMGHIDEEMLPENKRKQIFDLLDGKAPSRDPQGEAYRLLVVAVCNFWNRAMPFLFERINDFTELLMPDDLLSGNSILAYTREAMTPELCGAEPVVSGQWPVASKDNTSHQSLATSHSNAGGVEVIGWLYQFYISEKKDEVFDGLKKNRKITPENIPAATQLFTPHWIVKYLVENSLGRLWMLNRPDSRLADRMEYYIRPETSVASGQGLVDSKGEQLYDRAKLQGSDRLAKGDGNGKANLQADSELSQGGALRTDQSASPSSGISSIEHSRGSSQTRASGIQEFSFDSTGISGGSGDTVAHSSGSELHQPNSIAGSFGTALGSGQNAQQSHQQTSHQPLATTRSASTREDDFLRISKPEEIKICDPACGSGHMLTYAFDLLYAIYEEEGYEPAEIPEKILTHNLYGIEIDERAGELAAFALTMKARAKQRRFFNKGVKPNICMLEKLVFDENELVVSDQWLVASGASREDILHDLNLFEEADNFGSLVRPRLTSEQCTKLRDYLTGHWSLATSHSLFDSMTHQKVLQALRQADYLSPKYHVVVANPPYMGSKGMNERLTTWVKEQYQHCWDRGTSDLYAMFIDRAVQLTLQSGATAMITMQGWMFTSSFELLRSCLLADNSLVSVIHLGTRAFDSIAGHVVSTVAFVFQVKSCKDQRGYFFRLTSGENEESKRKLLTENIHANKNVIRYTVHSKIFNKIPGSPVSYWISKKQVRNFETFPLIACIADFKAGLSTGDNTRFQRAWHEVDLFDIAFTCNSSHEIADRNWVPCNSGGIFRKWYGNNEIIIFWKNNGEAIKQFRGSAIRNENEYFKSGLTYNKISSGKFACREKEAGFIFDDTGRAIVCDRERIDAVQSLLSSTVANCYLDILAPTLSFTSKELERIPFCEPRNLNSKIIKSLVKFSRIDWDSYETSWDFTNLPLLNPDYRQPTLNNTYKKLRAHWQEMTLEMQRLEEENNRIFIEAYGLQDELSPEVPLNEITLTCNPYYRYGNGKSEEELERLLLADTMRELVSYAVGCMFGRYALDKPGLILANQGETVADFVRIVGEYLVTSNEKGNADEHQQLPGSGSVAEGVGRCGNDLSGHEALSKGGSLRADESDSEGGRVDSVEHSGGPGTQVNAGLQKVSSDRPRVESRIGDSTITGPTSELSYSGSTDSNHESAGRNLKNDQQPASKTQIDHSLLDTQYSFLPDEDNVIPVLDGDWFFDDITERFRMFLRVAFGEKHYEENLRFVEQSLNVKGKRNYSIRDFFLGEFYNDHVKRYKKRPIYWLFSSSKGSFNALIYMHRYRPDTVSLVLGYLRDFRTKLVAEKNSQEVVSVSANTSQGDKTKALKEIEKINKTIAELDEYEREVLYPLATEQVEIDLDDGVKVNYQKFGTALKKIVGLETKED